MIRVIIIDDEPLAISMVKEYLETYDNIEIVADCPNGFAGAKAINELKPDLIFLDVQMPKITGFEMLEILDHIPAVIFTTAFDEFAIKAFEANAIDYLLKPFEKDRFDVAMQKFIRSYSADANPKIELSKELKMNRLVLKDAGEISILALKDVH
jgi:two-component system, LytTR family, response regulator